MFDGIERHPSAEGTYPERRDFPELTAGKKYKAKVHLANPGYGDAHEPEISLFLTNLDGKKKKSLPPLKVEIYIREGEEMRVSWTLPLSAKLKPGLYRLHAVADPADRVRELDEANNSYSRIIRVIAP